MQLSLRAARQLSPNHQQPPEAEQLTEGQPYHQAARHQQDPRTAEAAVRAHRAEVRSADSPQHQEVRTHTKEAHLHTKEVLPTRPHVLRATAAAVAADIAEAAQVAVADTAAEEHPEAADLQEEEDKKPLRLI